MARATPIVDGEYLTLAAGPLSVGSVAWFAWLNEATIFAYTGRHGTFTARKERAGRSGWYWKAYRRRGGVLRRTYLGKSEELTPERLAAAAATLAADPASEALTGAAPADTVLAAKLFVPRLRSDLVPRAQLHARLDAGLAGRLTLISAPTGSGKTTLLASWLTKMREEGHAEHARSSAFSLQPSAFAWLTLDVGDSEPAAFLNALIAALRTIVPHFGAAALPLLHPPQIRPDLALRALLNELARMGEPRLLLVLDDYHTIESPRVHEMVAALIDRLPPQAHLVIATRADPPLPLARLRAHREVNELRAVDLRCTPDEAAALLTEVLGWRLTQTDIRALTDRTEGWIAGLQLAALALRGLEPGSEAHATAWVAAFGGSNRYVLDYLVEEVLAYQPPEIQMFLLRTSILDGCRGSCAMRS